MKFLDRHQELTRLGRLATSRDGGLAVVYGRRRVGKTRLLLEWTARHGGVYTVADLSAADVQRRYFAEALAQRLPGFADVDYRDWRGLLDRLARDAAAAAFRGPIVFDELPYLVTASPELPSVLQRWLDHEAKAAGLIVAVAGSSQRMMQGLALSREAPLFGRAREMLAIEPLDATYLHPVFEPLHGRRLVELYAAWGGVPRYWELAVDAGADVRTQIDRLVLDPLGPLHREPDRLLLEEVPSAMEVRPLLDAIGGGAHRVSEIAGRLGRPATSMARPLDRLVEMGLVRREVPFGEGERKGKRALYKIQDPFFRLWFRVVAPHRALLAAGSPAARLELLDRFWKHLVAEAWEELCRLHVPRQEGLAGGAWGPVSRWWQGNRPEWDVVGESIDGELLLLGEARWSAAPFAQREVERMCRELAAREPPLLAANPAERRIVRVLLVPEHRGTPPKSDVTVLTALDLVPAEDAEDIAAFERARGEPTVSVDEVERDLRRRGRL